MWLSVRSRPWGLESVLAYSAVWGAHGFIMRQVLQQRGALAIILGKWGLKTVSMGLSVPFQDIV